MPHTHSLTHTLYFMHHSKPLPPPKHTLTYKHIHNVTDYRFTYIADVDVLTTGSSFRRTSSGLRSSVRSSSGVFMYCCRSNSSRCSSGISNFNLLVFHSPGKSTSTDRAPELLSMTSTTAW